MNGVQNSAIIEVSEATAAATNEAAIFEDP